MQYESDFFNNLDLLSDTASIKFSVLSVIFLTSSNFRFPDPYLWYLAKKLQGIQLGS